MKIIGLTAENVKKLSVVEIKPDGNLVQITGKNGQGKTSVLDCISWALDGTETIQASPIRKGHKEARIKLDLGDIIVRRTFKTAPPDEDGKAPPKQYLTSIIVENAEGARYPSPQKMLDSLFGSLSMDPLGFVNMGPKQQFETIKVFVPGIDFAAIEKANAADYAARTEANRRAKDARSQASGITLPLDLPDEPEDEAALVASLEEAGKFNADIIQRQGRRDAVAADIKRLLEQAGAHRVRAEKLRTEADAADAEALATEGKASELQGKLTDAPPLPEPRDTAAIKASIAAAQTQNKLIGYKKQKATFEQTANSHELESKRLTAAMEKREADKRKAIAEAKLPIAGIEFGDGHILMNGVPFDQASDAEKLRASVSIAMAMNPKLRVIRVRDGSLLDEDGIKLLAEMADKADCQIWIERVDSSGKIGFVLEDGHLKAEHKEAAE